MADPLHRSGSDSTDSEDKTLPYLKGFHSAEMRKPIINPEPGLLTWMLTGAFSALPIVGIYWFQLRTQHVAQMANAGVKTGKSNSTIEQMRKGFSSMMDPTGSRNFKVEVKDTKFKDVIAVPEALVEVRQYVDFLKKPQKFTRLGGRLPKGCLLTGEPGTGKTLLAKAVAGEADVPFYSCSGADFIEVYVGSGPKRVRELFEEARKDSPAVIFIDEIDAIGSRGGNNKSAGGVSQEENRTINQLLAELDGLGTEEGLVVFAATNYQDNLDKALLREGRFDRKVEVPMPDVDARTELFKHYLDGVITGDPAGKLSNRPKKGEAKVVKEGENKDDSKKSAEETEEEEQQYFDVEPDPNVSNLAMAKELASLTPGLSPATISTIVNEAALHGAVGGDKVISMKYLRPAIDDVVVGKKQRSRMTDNAAARVALHEAGHCLAAWLLPQQSKVIKLSITPRGRAAGFTQQVGREVLDSVTDRMLFTDICVMLGGRTAELMKYDTLTTGASDDLQRATKNAINQFLAFGMSERVGMLAHDYSRLDSGRMYQLMSEKTQFQAEMEASKLVDSCFQCTKKLLEDNKDLLFRLTDELLKHKELTEEQIKNICGPRLDDPTLPLPPTAQEAMDKFLNEGASLVANKTKPADVSSSSSTGPSEMAHA